MGKFRALTIATGLIVALPQLAAAADLLPPPPQLAPPPLRGAIYDTSEWYIRGDVGLGMTQTQKWSQDLSATEQSSTILSRGFSQKEIGDTVSFGAGVGYRFNNWFRTDLTGEFRSGRTINGILEESSTFLDGAGAQHSFIGQNVYGGGRMSSFVALLNGYVDIGTWSGITPYVGAGVGIAYNRVTGLAETGGFASIDGAASPVASSTISNGSKSGFAWALMAGLSYDIAPNLKLDLGYRYLNIGDARSGQVNCNPLFCGAGPAPGLRFKDLSTNEVRIGLRWALADMAPLPPQPIVTKY